MICDPCRNSAHDTCIDVERGKFKNREVKLARLFYRSCMCQHKVGRSKPVPEPETQSEAGSD